VGETPEIWAGSGGGGELLCGGDVFAFFEIDFQIISTIFKGAFFDCLSK
jgi:hypothetical protein